MKPLKFRLKIALLSLLISGAVLCAFGVFFLGVIYRLGIERIDSEIRAVGEGQLRVRRPPERWSNLEASLRFIYGEESAPRFAVQVRDRENTVLFTSHDCPPAVSKIAIPPRFFDSTSFLPPPPHPPPAGGPAPPQGGYGTPLHAWPGPPRERRGPQGFGPDGRPPPRMRRPEFHTLSLAGGEWRVGMLGNDSLTMIVAMDLADLHAEARRFGVTFLIAAPLALLLLAGVGWILTTRALHPVKVITDTASGITASGLDRRIPPVAADAELSRLTEVINGMLNRLERSFGQALRFSADAAHELQTPLTILQGELEDAMQHAAEGSEEQRRYAGLLEEVRRLAAIVRKLLLLARADAGQLALNPEPLNLSSLVAEAVEDAGAMDPGRRIEQKIAPGLVVNADADLIGQVVRNMTTNAIRYGDPTGAIRFELVADSDSARFTLANDATPVPTADRERIFERFYRTDKARSRESGGSGLGLSLAREIARAHGGDLVLDQGAANAVVFTLTLPRNAAV